MCPHAAGIFLVVPAAGQLLHGDPSKVVGDEQLWLARCLILAWRPFPWLCCGGGWVAGLGAWGGALEDCIGTRGFAWVILAG